MKRKLTSTGKRNFTQTELVTLAVYLLGGNRKSVDTEDVAIKSYQLAPERFAWKKYPNQINLELVRVYLSDAKKKSKGAHLTGSGRTGWMLSASGLKWAKKAVTQVSSGNLFRDRSQTKSGSIEEVRWRRERSRIMSTRAWEIWSTGSTLVSPSDASEVFRIDSYATPRMLENKIMRLTNLLGDDVNLQRFVEDMAVLVRSHKETMNG